MVLFGVRPPGSDEENAEEDKREAVTGEFSHAEFATWFGNAIVLASIGTLGLLIAPKTKTC